MGDKTMKLRCIIGSQGFVGGDTYTYGDVYELNNEETAKILIEQGYAEEVATIASSVTTSPLVEANKKPSTKQDVPKATKSRRKY